MTINALCRQKFWDTPPNIVFFIVTHTDIMRHKGKDVRKKAFGDDLEAFLEVASE